MSENVGKEVIQIIIQSLGPNTYLGDISGWGSNEGRRFRKESA